MAWTFEENKSFENAIGELGLENPNLFQEIALRIPGKTIEQIQMHFHEMVKDIEIIENGSSGEALDYESPATQVFNAQSSFTVPPHRAPRRPPTPWTENEHEAFLVGLDLYGKGDWKSISRFCVPTKTPTQIASHAQKYFQKLRKFNQQEAASTTTQAQTSR